MRVSYGVPSPADSDCIASSFPAWIPFMSHPPLAAAVYVSLSSSCCSWDVHCLLSNSGESGHHCLGPDLSGEAAGFHHHEDVCCGSHTYGLCPQSLASGRAFHSLWAEPSALRPWGTHPAPFPHSYHEEHLQEEPGARGGSHHHRHARRPSGQLHRERGCGREQGGHVCYVQGEVLQRDSQAAS